MSNHKPYRRAVKRREAYRRYLLTKHWQKLRKKAFAKWGKSCKLCPNKGLIQIHHLRYRTPFRSAKVEDLMPLCAACHKLVHQENRMPMSAEVLIAKYERSAARVGTYCDQCEGTGFIQCGRGFELCFRCREVTT